MEASAKRGIVAVVVVMVVVVVEVLRAIVAPALEEKVSNLCRQVEGFPVEAQLKLFPARERHP